MADDKQTNSNQNNIGYYDEGLLPLQAVRRGDPNQAWVRQCERGHSWKVLDDHDDDNDDNGDYFERHQFPIQFWPDST